MTNVDDVLRLEGYLVATRLNCEAPYGTALFDLYSQTERHEWLAFRLKDGRSLRTLTRDLAYFELYGEVLTQGLGHPDGPSSKPLYIRLGSRFASPDSSSAPILMWRQLKRSPGKRPIRPR